MLLDRWLEMVRLSERPGTLDEVLSRSDFMDPLVINGLLSELALYLLIYTEGSNMRHCPEGMWFFYWCMAHSPQMEAIWRAGIPKVVHKGRYKRIQYRNTLQVTSCPDS